MGSAKHATARAVMLIGAAAVAAVLLRVEMTAAFSRRVASPNSALPPSLAANLLGSFILGALHSSGEYTCACVRSALATGFAGALTTFATAMFHAARLFVRGYVSGAFTSMFLTVLASSSAYVAGADVFSLFEVFAIHPNIHNEILATCICASVFILAWGVAILIAALDSSSTSRARWLAAVFAPPGAISRWFLSRLNKEDFPRGTLVANISACAVYSVLAALVHRGVGGRDAAVWLMALSTGFAGSLSTVSTFVAEIRSLGAARRLLYVLFSVVVAQVVFFAIYGIVVWTT